MVNCLRIDIIALRVQILKWGTCEVIRVHVMCSGRTCSDPFFQFHNTKAFRFGGRPNGQWQWLGRDTLFVMPC